MFEKIAEIGRKHALAIIGLAIIVLNRPMGLGLDHESVYAMVGLLGLYFLGEGASDLGEKLGLHVKDALAKIIANKLSSEPTGGKDQIAGGAPPQKT